MVCCAQPLSELRAQDEVRMVKGILRRQNINGLKQPMNRAQYLFTFECEERTQQCQAFKFSVHYHFTVYDHKDVTKNWCQIKIWPMN